MCPWGAGKFKGQGLMARQLIRATPTGERLMGAQGSLCMGTRDIPPGAIPQKSNCSTDCYKG